MNKLNKRFRFLDDIWGVWSGVNSDFSKFLECANAVGQKFGVQFTGDCDKSVVFSDVETENGKIKTSMYVKPTDSTRYLNRRSYHSAHTFKSMPFSQFQRAAVICSDMNDRSHHVERMFSKFVDSGYKIKDMMEAKEKAMIIDGDEILKPKHKLKDDKSKNNVLTFVANYDSFFKKELKTFFKKNDADLKQLIGDCRIVVAEKRHSNISSLLFKKN